MHHLVVEAPLPPILIISRQEHTILGELARGFQRPAITPNATETCERKTGALDHMVASAGMQEAAVTARVTGCCVLAACAGLAVPMPAAPTRLSDYCPVVVEIRDRELD
jgi:hypothetical protein